MTYVYIGPFCIPLMESFSPEAAVVFSQKKVSSVFFLKYFECDFIQAQSPAVDQGAGYRSQMISRVSRDHWTGTKTDPLDSTWVRSNSADQNPKPCENDYKALFPDIFR